MGAVTNQSKTAGSITNLPITAPTAVVNQTKNTGAMVNQAFGSQGQTWDQHTETWDQSTGTWDRPEFATLQAKNSGSIVNQTKN